MTDRGAWSLQSVINQAAGIEQHDKPPGDEGSGSRVPFIQSATWQGAKPGYYFSRGRQGQGYYRDSKQGSAGDNEAADDEGDEGIAAVTRQQPLDPEELLRQAEEDAHIGDIQQLDARGLKRIVASFEKKYKENLELRMKYPDAPDKFLDSEVDLDEQVKSLMQVASSPELFPLLVELNPFATLMACVGHENSDIAADTLEVLRELTDADVVDEYQEEVAGLVAGLLEVNALELLVQRLTALDEKVEEESKAVFNCLTIFENMIELDPGLAEQLVERTRLLKWLLTRLKVREFDGNKLQASELLAVLMQGNEANHKKLRSMNGIDVLLQCVAAYKNKDPGSAEEEELMQNCFDVLCGSLMYPEGKSGFVSAEGVELMWLMLSSKKQSRYGALKLLDFAATRYAPPCEKLVDLGGLKHLFGIFMGKSKIKGPKGERDVEAEVEERCVSLVSSLLTQLTSKAGRRERVGAKFVEAEFEKTDRLMEIFFRYQERVGKCEMSLQEQLDDEEELDEDDIQIARMDAGLFTLQQAALILGHLWALGDTGLRKRVLSSLHLKSQSLASIREVVVEYYGSIGDDGSPEEAERLLGRVREALVALGTSQEQISAARSGKTAGASGTAKDDATQQQQRQQQGAAKAGDGDDMDVEAGGAAGRSGTGQETSRVKKAVEVKDEADEKLDVEKQSRSKHKPDSDADAGRHRDRSDRDRDRVKPERDSRDTRDSRSDRGRSDRSDRAHEDDRDRHRDREHRESDRHGHRDKDRERERERGADRRSRRSRSRSR